MISVNFDNTYRIDHYENPRECYELLKECSERYWREINRPGKTNYDFTSDSENTIKYLIDTDRFTLGYSILYENNLPMAFGGIRKMNDDTTIIASRAFCFYTPKLLINKILVPYHLTYSKSNGFTRSVISFNEYNHKIYRLWQKLSDSPDIVDRNHFTVDYQRFTLMGTQVINKMNQYTIEWNL